MAVSGDSKLGELLDNPEAKAVIVRHCPEIENAGPMLAMARGMTLKTVSNFPQANISKDKLALIEADLAKI